MRILILAPHVDDEIYSCLSIIHNALVNNHELILAYTSESPKQTERMTIVRQMLEEQYGPNSFEVRRLAWFKDGESSFSELKRYVTILDNLLVGTDYFFFPAMSNHQDHIVTHTVSMSSLRYRASLTLKGAFMYEYMYNHDNVPSEFFEEMSENLLDFKIKILEELNVIDTILSETSVNSEQYVRAMATINGARINKPAAESFKVHFLNNGII